MSPAIPGPSGGRRRTRSLLTACAIVVAVTASTACGGTGRPAATADRSSPQPLRLGPHGAVSALSPAPGGALWLAVPGRRLLVRIDGHGALHRLATPFPAEQLAATNDAGVWFSAGFNDRIARVTAAGRIIGYPRAVRNGAGMSDIASGRRGEVWFTENLRGRVARLSPGGDLREFPFTPRPRCAADCSSPGAIAVGAGPDAGGTVVGLQLPWPIARAPLQGGLMREAYPQARLRTWAQDIAIDRTGTAWLASAESIVRVRPTGPARRITRGISEQWGDIDGLVAAPDGGAWFLHGRRIGRVRADGTATEYAVPDISHPTALAPAPDGDLWVAGDDVIVRARPDRLIPVAAQGLSVTDDVLDATAGAPTSVRLTTRGPAAISVTARQVAGLRDAVYGFVTERRVAGGPATIGFRAPTAGRYLVTVTAATPGRDAVQRRSLHLTVHPRGTG